MKTAIKDIAINTFPAEKTPFGSRRLSFRLSVKIQATAA